MRVLIVADDLTGAAEVAMLARRMVGPTRLMLGDAPIASISACDSSVVVLDLGTRLMSGPDAARKVQDSLRDLSPDAFDLIYHKCDSALRGNVLIEAEAIAQWQGVERVELCPQNPSRGRTISGGVYRVQGVELHCTELAHDPHHPCATSIAADLLRERAGSLAAGGKVPQVMLHEASTASDVQAIASRHSEMALYSGGVDLLAALLRTVSSHRAPAATPLSMTGPMLMVQGSASASSSRLLAQLESNRVASLHWPRVWKLPRGATGGPCHGVDWCRGAEEAMRAGESVVLAIGPPVVSPAWSAALTESLASAAGSVLRSDVAQVLAMEGGTTSLAVARVMGWHAFDATAADDEEGCYLTPVGTRIAPRIVLKPGSYTWPDWILKRVGVNLVARGGAA